MEPELRSSRLKRGAIVFAAGAVALGLHLAVPRYATFGIAIGAVLLAVATAGIFLMLAAFAPAGEVAARAPRLWQRPGLLVVLIAAALYLPRLGSGGLWDPWETHYGEVARRMLERNDWISMWWENEWFYSKPVLIMWLQAFGMALVGANPHPDGQPFLASWGMRLPVTILAIACAWGVYLFTARVFGRRAGFVAAIALATMPTYAFLAHQTMTDMPYVATMSLGMCLLGYALVTDDEKLLGARRLDLGRLGAIVVGPFHAFVALLVVAVLPFSLYLLSRPMTYESGSAGQDNVESVSQVAPVPLLVVGLPALAGLGWVLYSLRRERRARRIALLAAYLFVGLAVLGKVLPGIVLPAMVLFFWLLATGRWGELRRLEIPRGMAVFALVALPWYIAKTIRHGQPFIDRIIFHDVVNRAVVGVHGDTGSAEYFLQQLGYGTFPWLALLPLGIFGFAWYRKGQLENEQAQMRAFALLWMISLFVFFSGVITKFHHYVFPTIVPMAILVGVAFDDLVSRRAKRPEPALVLGIGLLAAVGLDLAHGEGAGKPGYERLVDLFIYNYNRVWPEGAEYDFAPALATLVTVAILVTLPLLVPKLRGPVGGGAVVFGLLFGGFCLDVYMPAVGPHWSQQGLIERYYVDRAGPEERLVAYQMNWKGENFYTGNRVVVHVSLETDGFERWVREHQGERHFFITERSRYEGMRGTLDRISAGAGARMEEIGPAPGPERGRLCNKFRMGVTTL
jgi:4-amino-4-deoxy-L-arabinose transferase-like glycosyltransferase